MGLAGTKTRRKIGDDPNNTRWSRNETNFGHKILRAQGWEPGNFLGARDSTHVDLHTAASAAPIKVVLKDDTMGLGAKQRQKQSTECTGLDGFKDLLGRLNGKSDDTIEKERKLRCDIKTSLYVERKFGTMRFVSGGLLVGDQMKALESTDPATLDQESAEQSTSESMDSEERPSKKGKKDKKSKKRKAEESEPQGASDAPQEKKRKKRSKDEAQDEPVEDSESKEETKERKKSKKAKKGEIEDDDSKSKKAKTEKKSKRAKDKPDSTSAEGSLEDAASREKEEKKKRKKEKKEKKLASTADAATSSTTTPADSGMSTPTGTGTSTPVPGSRHHVRARFIASKRSAFADMAALNQIFMVKPV